MENNEPKDLKSMEILGEFTTSASGMRKVADWIEEKVGHDGDCIASVSVYDYGDIKTLGYSFGEKI